MHYLTKHTVVAFVAGSLMMAGVIPLVHGLPDLQMPQIDTSHGTAAAPKANGAVYRPADSAVAATPAADRRARAGETAGALESPLTLSTGLARGRGI